MYSYTVQEVKIIRDAMELALFELVERESLMTGTDEVLLEAIDVLDGVVRYTDNLVVDLILEEVREHSLREL